MTITAFSAVPNRATNTRAEFEANCNLLLDQLVNRFVDEVNAVAIAMNLNATTDSSVTSNTVTAGAKTFAVSSGKSFQPGMYLVIADTAAPSTNSMVAQVTSYSGTSLVVNVISVTGSGTKTAWTISQSGLLSVLVGDHEVTVHTGNGHGSTNTKVRRFTTTLRSVGTAITYADSATLGATFTINEPGLYEICYQDVYATGNASLGVSLNSATLTTSIASITDPAVRVLIGTSTSASASQPECITRTLRLAAADVIRPHTDGNVNGATSAVLFSIRKIGY